MEMRAALDRIETRLKAVGLSAWKASRLAGVRDAIRSLKRGVQAGEDITITAHTIERLAPVLKTTAAWLLTGEGREDTSTDMPPPGRTFEDSPFDTATRWALDEALRFLGVTPAQAAAVVARVELVASAQPTPPLGMTYEEAVRAFVRLELSGMAGLRPLGPAAKL